MQVGRKVVFVMAANVAGAVLGYGALLVIGRTFSPSAYGSFVFASGIGGLFALATTLGLGSAHQRLVARGMPADVVMGTAARIRALLLCAGIAAIALLAWLLHAVDRPVLTDATTPAVLGAALAVHVLAMGRLFLAETWAGHQQVTRIETTRTLDAALLLLFLANAGLLVAHLSGRWTPLPGVGAWWARLAGLDRPLAVEEAALLLVGCTLAAKLVSYLVAAAWALRDGLALGPMDRQVARELWAFGLPVALTGAVGLIVQYTDVVLLGFFWTAREVGLYGTAQKLAVLASLAAGAASGVLFSRFAQLSARADEALEARTFRDAERWVFLLVAPMAAALAALAVPGIHIAVGDAYIPGADALRLLAGATFAYALQVPLAARFMGHGMTRVLVVTGVVNAGANLALNLAFIPRQGLGWGAEGAAFATLLSNLLAYGVLRARAHRAFGTPWVDGPTLRTTLAAAAVGGLWWQASLRWPEAMDRVWELAAWGVGGGVAYLALLALAGGLERRDLDLLRRAAHPRALWHELRGK